MKFKLDENFGNRTVALFRQHGHDVGTVHGEKLAGCSDHDLFDTCVRESRCLVTLDLDFADVTRFPPHLSAGMAVIRVPRNPSLDLLIRLVNDFLDGLRMEHVAGRLWIVEPGRIRIHSDTIEEE
jgi:hypothetical protein